MLGERASRLRRFLSDHPLCCYCGDAAETEDHCPARICFREKIGPEGWSFPSCRRCNSAISGTEQVVAFFIRALDHTDENLREADLQRLLRGVQNNHPEVMPDLNPSPNEKRRMMRHLGIERQRGEFLEEVPVLAVPPAVVPHFEYFNRKLAAALFYRQTGQILSGDQIVMSHWFQSQDPSLASVLETLAPAWSHKLQGQRNNLQFGDQLSVILAAASAPTVMSYIVQFGSSLCFWGGAGTPTGEERPENWKAYRPLREGI
jgi:hypothetical protein